MGSNPNNRLQIIQSRINQYGIRFPIAELESKLGFDKGYVSALLNGKKPVSDNFWSKFNEAYPIKVDLPPSGQQNGALPGHATLQDHIELYKKWLADKETKYQDSHSANLRLLELLNTKLADIESNLKTGQHQIQEQLFAVGESLGNQLEGVSLGLAALAKDRDVVKKDKDISGRQRGSDGKDKSRS